MHTTAPVPESPGAHGLDRAVEAHVQSPAADVAKSRNNADGRAPVSEVVRAGFGISPPALWLLAHGPRS